MTFAYRQAVEAELAKHPAVVAVIEGYVVAGVQGAQEQAPIETGHYHESLDGALSADRRGVVGHVFSIDFAAHLVEFGSVNNPAYAPLRNGVESTGLRVTDNRGSRSDA